MVSSQFAPEEFLSEGDIALIAACLRAAEAGPFFPDWEFQTLFGIERSDVAEVRRRWPHVDLGEMKAYLAVVNSIANLLGYPHGEEEALRTYISTGRQAILQLADKVAALTSSGLGQPHDPL